MQRSKVIEQVEEKGKLQDAMIDSIMSTIKTHTEK